MKIKKILAMLLAALGICTVLSGCTIYEDNETVTNREKYYKNDDEYERLKSYNELFSNNGFSYVLTKEQRKVIDEEFEKNDAVTYIQQSNGREVSVYESKYLRGCFVLFDENWLYMINSDEYMLKDCRELYKELNLTDFYVNRSDTGADDRGIIALSNEEYTLMDFDGYTPFSVNYDDVDVVISNMPVKALVYENGGRVDKVELIAVVTPYKDSLTENNIAQVKGLLEKLGMGNESEALAEEFAQSLEKKSYSRRDGAMKVSSTRDVLRDKDTVCNVFGISIGG